MRRPTHAAHLANLFEGSPTLEDFFRHEPQPVGHLPSHEAEFDLADQNRLVLQLFEAGTVLLWIGAEQPTELWLCLAGGGRVMVDRAALHDLSVPPARAWAWPSQLPPHQVVGLEPRTTGQRAWTGAMHFPAMDELLTGT